MSDFIVEVLGAPSFVIAGNSIGGGLASGVASNLKVISMCKSKRQSAALATVYSYLQFEREYLVLLAMRLVNFTSSKCSWSQEVVFKQL